MTAEERHGDGETRGLGEANAAAQLLDDLLAAGVEFTFAGGKVTYRAPPGAFTGELRAAMQAHKAELLALLQVGAEPGPGPVRTAGENQPLGQAGSGERVPTSREDDPCRDIEPGGTLRIPLDDLVYGDFLERHGLRIVGGTAYPDGRTFRPTIYLADVAG
jgi:hypothetical protein